MMYENIVHIEIEKISDDGPPYYRVVTYEIDPETEAKCVLDIYTRLPSLADAVGLLNGLYGPK